MFQGKSWSRPGPCIFWLPGNFLPPDFWEPWALLLPSALAPQMCVCVCVCVCS